MDSRLRDVLVEESTHDRERLYRVSGWIGRKRFQASSNNENRALTAFYGLIRRKQPRERITRS